MLLTSFLPLLALVSCAPFLEIAQTEKLIKQAMKSQSSITDSVKAFNPSYLDHIHPENFAVYNKLSTSNQNMKVFKEIMVNQQQAVKKSQTQLDALRSLQASNLHPISDNLIASAENSLVTQTKALASLENVYEASLRDRKAASLLRQTNANQLAQDKQISAFQRAKALKEQAEAARSIKSKDAQLKAIEEARAARNPFS